MLLVVSIGPRSSGALEFHKSTAFDPDIEFILAFASSGCMHLATGGVRSAFGRKMRAEQNTLSDSLAQEGCDEVPAHIRFGRRRIPF